MNHRSVPFQFMSIDPAKRQAELEKRFGIPKSSDNKMHLDLGNPSLFGMRKEPSSASSSPRLQHRVPIFVEGMDEPAQSKADANPTNVDAGQKPRVRVVPIEVETDDTMKRARAFSGDPYSRGPRLNNTRPKDPWFDTYELKPELEPRMSGPRVCNIPIKVERASSNVKPKSPVKKVPIKKEPVVKTVPVQKETVPKPLQEKGCNATKQSAPSQEQVPSPLPHEVSLKKIAVVMDKLVGYQADVEKFSGTSKEKQYRYLDEMLTRLMLDLDNVETMGNEDVRLKRKDAIRKVQHSIDLLESKVCDNNQATSSQDNSQEMVVDPNIEASEDPKLTDEEMVDSDVPKMDEVEMKDSEEEATPTEIQVEEAVTAASQPGVDGDLPKPEEKTEAVQDSEVVESEDVNPQEEIVSEPNENELSESGENFSEPIVNELSESGAICPDETQVEESEIKITEVQSDSDSNQSMEVDGAEDKASVPETVTKLEVDNSNGDVCETSSIPDTKTDFEMNNQIVKNVTCGEGVTESYLSRPSS